MSEAPIRVVVVDGKSIEITQEMISAAQKSVEQMVSDALDGKCICPPGMRLSICPHELPTA